jgi:succinate dehydrogenase / fumarate reductase, cytochrome b subunit
MATLSPTASRRASVRTTIAMKIVMALSGAFFVLFVAAHMYGNLKVFAGQAAFDEYAHHLRTFGEPILPYSGFLWVLRVGLVVALVAHAGSAFYLWRRANGARSTRYAVKKAAVATLSSRTMRWGGVALLLFLGFHLAQFTWLTITIGGTFDSPYERVYAAFSVWWVVAIYLAALAALGMHLRHGVWSACQTLGLTGSPQAARVAGAAAVTVALVVAVGFALPPLAILFGLI